MPSLTDCGVALFGDTMPSFDELRKLARFVNASESNRLKFMEQLEQAKDRERQGIGYVMTGNLTRGAELLADSGTKQGLMYLGWSQDKLKQCDEALKSFEQAKKKGAEALMVCLSKACALRHVGRTEECEKELDNCSNLERVSAEYHYQLGRLRDAQGRYQDAMDNYEIAVEIDSGHQAALFHLAYACDLRGDEEAAIDYYKQITNNTPVYVNALLNLAVLYEDKDQYEKALKCVHAVLDAHPNHPKALLFRKDLESSRTMIYDEEKEKRLDKQNKILEIPISDFELSVRSRNCLRKMNIRTLGDLLRITEAELLSYKNFGETSLNEIKKILDIKGLSLGMAIQDKPASGGTSAQLPEGADDSLLAKPVEDLELSVRSRRCLSRLGVRSIGDLAAKTEAELLGCKNFGVTSLNEIKDRLTVFGLNLRTLD